jgi:hypothetical protein
MRFAVAFIRGELFWLNRFLLKLTAREPKANPVFETGCNDIAGYPGQICSISCRISIKQADPGLSVFDVNPGCR